MALYLTNFIGNPIEAMGRLHLRFRRTRATPKHFDHDRRRVNGRNLVRDSPVFRASGTRNRPRHDAPGDCVRRKEDDDIDDIRTWFKANPSMEEGQIISQDDFARELAEAKLSPATLQNFRRLRLNIISQGENKFVDMNAWDACGGAWIYPHLCVGLPWVSIYPRVTICQHSPSFWGDFTNGFDVDAKFWLPRGNIAELEPTWATLSSVGRRRLDHT